MCGLCRGCRCILSGGGNAVQDHAQDSQRYSAQLLWADAVSQEGPSTQQHQNRLAVSQDLRTKEFSMQPMSVKHEAGAKSSTRAHCLLAVC